MEWHTGTYLHCALACYQLCSAIHVPACRTWLNERRNTSKHTMQEVVKTINTLQVFILLKRERTHTQESERERGERESKRERIWENQQFLAACGSLRCVSHNRVWPKTDKWIFAAKLAKPLAHQMQHYPSCIPAQREARETQPKYPQTHTRARARVQCQAYAICNKIIKIVFGVCVIMAI